MINSFNPDSIAIGGGVTNEWDLFSDRMLEVMEERALKANLENLKVIKATLGSDVGIMGCRCRLGNM